MDPEGGRRRWGNDEGGSIWCKYCVHIHVCKEKMILLKLFLDWLRGRGGMKENGQSGEFKYYVFDIL
jgi:hypothetical protein